MSQKNKDPSSYWELRNIAAEKKVNDGAKVVEQKVITAYLQAQRYLTRQVTKLFSRTQQKTGLSEEEAKNMLNATVPVEELVELKRLAKTITDPELQKEAQQRLNGLALKHRITRLEDLKAKSFLVSKQVANVQLGRSTDFYIDTIHDSYNEAVAEATIHNLEKKGVTFEIWNKKALENNGHELKELSTEYTKNILDSHWQGSNYSKRIWNDTEALAKRLEELFTVESMTGMSEFEMAKAIANEFDRSVGVAKRLIRTEANYMANQAKLKAWQDRGVERYILIAVLDLRTSSTCQEKDHKIYLVSEAVVNGKEGTYPPFHPWCRTIAVIYLGDDRSLTGNRMANDPISGKTMSIKQMETYDDWMNKLKGQYSDDEISLQKKKIRNATKDNKQFLDVKSILGKKNSPSTLEEYQEMKYNDGNAWKKLKDNYFVKCRINDGRFGSIINPEKQAPHMKSTVGKGKSYFSDDVDVQELFDKYAGTGTVEVDINERRKNTEIITTKEFKGYAVNYEGIYETNVFKIHHSKNRTHVVPYKGG